MTMTMPSRGAICQSKG